MATDISGNEILCIGNNQSEVLQALRYVEFLENKLDRDIGNYYWKKYVAAAFWAQISTPVNLIITLLTAVTTAQATSQNILSEYIYQIVAVSSLVITTLNTFFRPHSQLTYNTEMLQKWGEIGIEFEKVYYMYLDEDYDYEHIENMKPKQLENKIKLYRTIQDKINNQRKNEGVGTINFITDLIFLISMNTCIRSYKCWLDHDKKIQLESKAKMIKEKSKQLNLNIRATEIKESAKQAMTNITNLFSTTPFSDLQHHKESTEDISVVTVVQEKDAT